MIVLFIMTIRYTRRRLRWKISINKASLISIRDAWSLLV